MRSRNQSVRRPSRRSPSPRGESRGRARRPRRRNSRSRSRDRADQGRRRSTPSPDRRRRRLSEPTRSVIVRGLPLGIGDAALAAAVGDRHRPTGVRVIPDRGFGFVQFDTVREAEDFLHKSIDRLRVEGRAVQLDFSRSAGRREGSAPARMDWLCGRCGVHNFARRNACFQCNAAKDETATNLPRSREYSRSSSVRSERTAVLIVSGLSPDVTTPDIRHAFAPYAAVQDVRLIKERARREKYGEKSTFAFVDFASPEVAASVFSQTRGLSIRGNPVHINFSRGGGGRRGNRTARDKFEPERPLNLSDAFVFDHKTGHYFDKNSGFFYDPTSGLYYHGQTGVHYRWDAMRGSYLQVDSRGVAIQPGATHTNPHTNPQAAAQSTAQSATSETKVQGQSQISSSSHISSGPMPTGAPTPSPDPATDTTKSTTGSKGKDSSKPQRKKKRKRQLGAGVLINFSLGKKKKSRAAQQTPAATMQSPEDVAKMAAEAAAAAASASKALAGLPMASPPWASMAPRDNTHVTTVAPPTAQPNPEILKPNSAAAPLAAVPLMPTDLVPQSIHLAPTRRVCLLCKRKFSGIDKLFLHARQSALHRKNLELYAVKQATLAARAEHSQPPPRRDPKRRKNKYAKRPQAAASVDKPIDGANRGAKLLQKMGWKKGQGLGRTASGIVAPVSARTLARGAGLGSGDLGPLGGGYNDVATMARSRYNRAGVTDPVANAVANTPASGQPASAAANSYLTAMNQFRAESCRDDGDHRRAMLK